jgi:hypothetical protein
VFTRLTCCDAAAPAVAAAPARAARLHRNLTRRSLRRLTSLSEQVRSPGRTASQASHRRVLHQCERLPRVRLVRRVAPVPVRLRPTGQSGCVASNRGLAGPAAWWARRTFPLPRLSHRGRATVQRVLSETLSDEGIFSAERIGNREGSRRVCREHSKHLIAPLTRAARPHVDLPCLPRRGEAYGWRPNSKAGWLLRRHQRTLATEPDRRPTARQTSVGSSRRSPHDARPPYRSPALSRNATTPPLCRDRGGLGTDCAATSRSPDRAPGPTGVRIRRA